ncbi:MAG: LuxR C-terminal-related transcriptional regulator, partial [Muribaculaceae bacterium]|nr:LuxR C-terminal-related transcriptional regulator [Muribaculaceae bacterium]
TRTTCPDFLLVNPSFGGLFNPIQWKREMKLPDVKILAIEIGKLNPETAGLFDGVISVMDDLETISRKLQSLREPLDNSRDKDSLSIREKEIISLVVRGLTNQEIADKLFLSIHTVITHRRNIARKLEIHSATGLTIYAIVNKIVDIADIKL